MSTTSITAERNRKVVEAFFAGTHSPDIDDVDIIDTTVAPSIVCHGFPGGDPFDHESYKSFFRVFRRSFTDMTYKMYTTIADDEYVAVRWQIWVSHTGDFAGVKGDGRRVTFDGMVIYRMEDRKIAETWLQINQVMLLSQIGAIPAMAA